MHDDLHFTPALLERPPSGPLTVVTSLEHFSIVTYAVAPEALRPLVHERFELDRITTAAGEQRALVSVVPFLDRDFRFARCPFPKWSFGQTNYRAYVRDRATGEHAVWFFGTALGSPAVTVPRYAWKLPWYRARFRFDVHYDAVRERYDEYRVSATSKWAPMELELEDTGAAPTELDGFERLETGLVLLTHPLRGYYHRRDGALGSYSIWHATLRPSVGRVRRARFPLLDRLGLVAEGDLAAVHSVLIQPVCEFSIYLPPTRVWAPHAAGGGSLSPAEHE